jgi:hypothetical protein
MILVSHRVNTLKELKKTDSKYGVEIDIRDNGSKLILVHDPFKNGVPLIQYLKKYNHSLLIANIKSERIEDKVISIFKKFKIRNYFFLDSSFPKIVELSRKKFKKIAVRASYYEGYEAAKKLKNKVDWIWLDTFLGIPSISNFRLLKKLNYKICLVSPELHNKNLKLRKEIIKKLLKFKLLDAVCTKKILFHKWLIKP